jgi:hypothetical protein
MAELEIDGTEDGMRGWQRNIAAYTGTSGQNVIFRNTVQKLEPEGNKPQSVEEKKDNQVTTVTTYSGL